MEIKHLKIANIEDHKYFVQTVHNILCGLNFNYTFNEIEKMTIENDYYLYFHNKKTKRWHLGIWAVGKWGVKTEIDGKVCDCGYGVDTYKPLTICVFLVHDWTYDKFRPTYSDWQTLIEYGGDIENVKEDLKYIFKHPITSYYNMVDEDSYNFQHHESNKYKAYIKAWYYNVFSEILRRKIRRIKGYIATHIFMIKSRFDKRVAHREYKFHKDKWNNEYEIAIVFKYGETEWDDWKAWFDYKTLFEKLYRWNIWVNFNYLDEEGNMPDRIWRGVYWEGEPEKE